MTFNSLTRQDCASEHFKLLAGDARSTGVSPIISSRTNFALFENLPFNLLLCRAEFKNLNNRNRQNVLRHYDLVADDSEVLAFQRRAAPRERHYSESLLANSSTEYTAILNVWRRPASQLARQIESLISQTVPPKEIWICAFGLDKIGASVYESYLPKQCCIPIYWFYSDFNLKYHGRFQIGMSAITEFVAVIDDDIIPGREFLENCGRAMLELPDAGDVGIYGWECLPDPLAVTAPYTSGKASPHQIHEEWPAKHLEMDLLWGFHFIRTETLRHLMIYSDLSRETGEDFQIAAALRSRLGKKSYSLAVNRARPETWGLSPDWLEIREGATTHGEMDILRQSIYETLLRLGVFFNWMRDYSRIHVVFGQGQHHTPDGTLQIDIPLHPFRDTKKYVIESGDLKRVYCDFYRNGVLDIVAIKNLADFLQQHSVVSFSFEGIFSSEIANVFSALAAKGHLS